MILAKNKYLAIITIGLLFFLGTYVSDTEMRSLVYGGTLFVGNFWAWYLISGRLFDSLLGKGQKKKGPVTLFLLFLAKVLILGLAAYIVIISADLNILYFAGGFGGTMILVSLAVGLVGLSNHTPRQS